MKFKIMLSAILLIVSESSYASEKPTSFQEATKMVKEFARHIDTKVIDATILTLCTTGGAQLGHSLNIFLLDQYYESRYKINYDSRMDDDFGWWFGGAIGAEFGHFFIKLRHQVTDPLFPAIYNLCAATTNTGKVLIESNVQRASQFMCNKVNGMTNYLKQYSTKKTT